MFPKHRLRCLRVLSTLLPHLLLSSPLFLLLLLRAGADVMQAFTFYASEDMLTNRGNTVGEALGVEAINRAASRLAKKVASFSSPFSSSFSSLSLGFCLHVRRARGGHAQRVGRRVRSRMAWAGDHVINCHFDPFVPDADEGWAGGRGADGAAPRLLHAQRRQAGLRRLPRVPLRHGAKDLHSLGHAQVHLLLLLLLLFLLLTMMHLYLLLSTVE